MIILTMLLFEVRGAKANLQWMIKASQGKWTDIIDKLFKDALETPEHLKDMGIDWGPDAQEHDQHQLASTLLEASLTLASNRAFSMISYEA